MLKGIILIILGSLLPVCLNAQINVTFSFDPNSACSGTSIQFTSTVTNGTPPYIYSWNFGDDTTSNIDNPNHSYNAYGCGDQQFIVLLTVTDTTGGGTTPVSHSETVIVKSRPNPQLTDLINDTEFSNCDNNPTPGDSDFPVRVQNNTPNNSCISTYTINWGDGSPPLTNLTNSSFPIDYTYTQLGAFDLTITAFGSNGCSGVTTYVVKNQSNPAVGISTPGNTQGCAPQTFSFTMLNYTLNSPGTTYLWDFGDNSPTIIWTQDSVVANGATISHTFITTSCGQPNNEFIVSVTASNSCSSTSASVSAIKIWSSPIANFDLNPVQGCVNSTCFSFSNTTIPGAWGSSCSSTATYQWDFGNGQTSTAQNPPCQTYSTVGTYSITLTASNNCGSSTITKEISVQNPPAAIATLDQNTGCVPFQVNFTNSSTGTDIQFTWSVSPASGWSYVNGTNNHSQNPVLQFTIAGTYTVNLNVTNACGSDNQSFTITAKDVPSINIPTIADDCIPYTYIGNASYVINGSNITSYLWSVSPPNGWNFVAPSNSGSQNPTILFSQTGTYQITVQATNECGTGSQISNSFDVISLAPVNAGNDTSVCLNSGNFQLFGNPSGGTWSGNNVTPSGIFSPVIVGSFTLTYSRGTGNCLSEDQIVLTVMPSPAVNAGPDISICADNEPIFLTGQPTGGTWNGTGIVNDTLGIFDPSVSGAGLFTVSYTIYDNQTGCSNSDNIIINVRPLPSISFSFEPPACVGDNIHFTNNCSNAESYLWDFGDGVTSTLFAPIHTYAVEGLYIVTLTAYSTFNCVSSDTMMLNVTVPPPQPAFEISPKVGCAPLTVYISIDESQYGDNAFYYWDFGNGTTSNLLVPPDSMVYYGGISADTIYRITFRCYNPCGSKIFSDSILVHPIPLSDFDMLHDWDCTPVEVQFKNVSKGLPDSFYWDLGDGTTSTEFEPVHIYITGNTSSLYTIKLISYNGCGTDTLSRELLVKPNTVDAFFTVDKFKGCEGDTFCFQNYSTDTSGVGISNLSWNFGDGQGSSTENPCHIFDLAGAYIVKLHIDNGCGHDDAYDTIEINPTPQIEIYLNNKACVGETLFFDYSTNVEIAGKIWYFGDGDSSLLSNPYHYYQEEGTYEVVLTGVSAYGFPACVGVAGKLIEIKPTPEAFILPDTSGCAPLQITFQGDSGSYHLWNFGDNTIFTSNPTHIFDSPGLYKVKLISEYSNLCRDADSIEIRVFPKPESQFTYTSSGGYPEQLTFVNTSAGASECIWDFGNGQVMFTCEVNEPIEYNNTGNYNITLITLNQYGCYDTAAVIHTVSFKGLFVPNAFAPEHPDPGVNLFLPKGIGILEYTIQIFDTWGNLVWQSSALDEGIPTEGWDGRNENGEFYPQDVYVWKVMAKFMDGTNWSGDNGKTYGTVTLIR